MAITIQRFPHAGGDPVTKTLAEWGLAPGSMESAAWTIGQLSLTARGESPALSDPVFEYLDTLKVFEGSTCIWWGPVLRTPSTVQPAQQRSYLVADPMWWVQRTTFVWPYSPEPAELDPELAGTWIGLAMAQAEALYPITWEASDLAAFGVPIPDLRGSADCLELIQRAARLYPLGMQWWDLSGAAPKLRCCARSGGTPVSLARSRCQEPITLEQLHDKRLGGVQIDYAWVNGSGTRSIAMDTGGAGPFTGPNSLRYTVRVGTDSAADAAANAAAASTAQSYLVASIIQSAYATAPWAGSLTVVGTPTNPLPAIRPGHLLNLTGGRTDWASMAAQVQRVGRTIGETCDRMDIELGCGEHLGPTDFVALARAGGASGGAGGGNPGPYDPPRPPPTPPGAGDPGTYDDLMSELLGAEPAFTFLTAQCELACHLYGLDENEGHVSSPPRYYLARNFGGAHVLETSGWIAIAQLFHDFWTDTASGSVVVNPETGESTSTGKITSHHTGQQLMDTESPETIDEWQEYTISAVTGVPQRGFGSVSHADVVGALGVEAYLRGPAGETTWAWESQAPGSGTHTVSGACISTLANENTEDGEIARKSALATWGGYDTEAKTGIYTIRTARDFTRRLLRYKSDRKVDGGGTTYAKGVPWGYYRLTVGIWQREIGGSWPTEPTSTQQHQLLCDLDGVLDALPETEVDCPRGYEIKVAPIALEQL